MTDGAHHHRVPIGRSKGVPISNQVLLCAVCGRGGPGVDATDFAKSGFFGLPPCHLGF